MVDENPYDPPATDDLAQRTSVTRNAIIWASEFIRTISRAASFSAFTVTLIGFIFYPRPWGSHWSTQKRITYAIINLGGLGAFICLLACVVACFFIPWTQTRMKRPLWPAFAANAASIVMTMMTPPV